MSRMTMLKVHVAKIKFLNPLHSFHNSIDIVFEVSYLLQRLVFLST